jgi:vitamin B12 transporter
VTAARLPLLAAAGLFVLAGPALAQTAAAGGPRAAEAGGEALEQLLVTASPSGRLVSTGLLGGSATVLDARALAERQTRLVSDVLRDVPGVAVNRTGPFGGPTQVRIRGAEGNHTLVLVDGMLAADPGTGEFDFANLYADEGARIEVLRGQQPIYGSNAIAGVVHYITATGKAAPGLTGRFEGGSFNTAQASVRYGAVRGPLDLGLSAGYYATDGAVSSRFGVRELDAKNTTLGGKLILIPRDNLRLIAAGRYIRTLADNNPTDYASSPAAPSYGLPVDGTDYYVNLQRMGVLRGELDLLGGRWTQGLGVQANSSRKRSFGGPRQPTSLTDAERLKYSYDSTLRVEQGEFRHTVTGVVDYDRTAYRNLPLGSLVTTQNARRHINDFALVGQYDLDWRGRLGLGAAVRHDDNTRFQSATTYRLQASYRFETGTRLHAAAGSGITNPTFTELYGYDPTSFVGNPDLKPERSRGWEAGLDQTLFGERLKLGAAYFAARLRDEIYTVFTPAFVSSSANRTTQSKQQGWELTAAARIGRQWRIDAAYTNLRATERGIREIRRPQHTASLNAAWRAPDDRFGATLSVRHNGRMTDSYFGATSQTKTLSAFTLVNLAGDLRVRRKLQLYGRVENLLRERYEEVFGFVSPGRAAYAGIRAAF